MAHDDGACCPFLAGTGGRHPDGDRGANEIALSTRWTAEPALAKPGLPQRVVEVEFEPPVLQPHDSGVHLPGSSAGGLPPTSYNARKGGRSSRELRPRLSTVSESQDSEDWELQRPEHDADEEGSEVSAVSASSPGDLGGSLRSSLASSQGSRRLRKARVTPEPVAVALELEAGTGGSRGGSTSSASETVEAAALRRRRSRCLPTQKLQRTVELGGIPEEEEDKERPPGHVDLMLMLPVGPQPGDDEPLARPGPDRANPAPGSASWFIKQIVCDDEVFTATSKREKVSGVQSSRSNGRATMLPQYFRPSVVVEYPLMKLCYTEALQEAETKGQLRERVTELLLRYLISAKCCFQVRAFLGCDGRQLFLGIYADELVLRGHADALSYQVHLDKNVARGLLRGSFTREELHPAFVRYDLEEEHKFRSLHSHSPFTAYHDTFSEAEGGSIFRSIDRMRIIERVISRVFNLEDMLEHGFLTARYACHSSLQQRALARGWATARLLHSPNVPLGAIRDYLGEAVTFRVCFLSFLTKALLPVVALAVAMEVVPSWLASKTALSMQMCLVLGVWGTAFFKLWLRTEQYWIMAWGMDTFKRREATRSRFIGSWGVSTVDRYTIVKVAPWTRQFYRRAFTFLVTCLFNLLLIGLVVALFGYRQRLLKAGDIRMAQAVYYLNAFQMLVFDTVWGYLALSLTDFDNYATESEYTEQVIQRIFVTRFINSFASLFYIAVVKQFMETCDDGLGCSTELAKQLRVLFGASMARSVFRPAFSYAWFRVVHMNKLRRAIKRQRLTGGYSRVEDSCHQSSLEVQASMPENSLSEDVEDVMDLIIELAFVMFFGCIAPEIIWIFCVSNLIRIRAWGWKLLFAVRRPFPLSAAGLGTLNKVVNIISASSVWCNILLCLMLNYHHYKSSKADIVSWLEEALGAPSVDSVSDGSVSWKSLLAVFLVLERTIFLVRGLIDYCIRHHSGSVELEEKRRDAMITAYYKLILEDAKVEGNQGMNETSVEALTPVGTEIHGEPAARAWYPVGVERILKACRQVKPEADAPVPPFTARDPGFEYPWDEQDTEDEVELSPPGSPRC